MRTNVTKFPRARRIGLDAGLRYVYEGNIPGTGEDTLCWSCKDTLIERMGFSIESNSVKKGKCANCGAVLDGVWE